MGELSSDAVLVRPLPDPICTQEAIRNLGPEVPKDPAQVAQLLIDAKKIGVEGFEDKISQLRLLRKPGEADRWSSDPENPINVMDRVVALLLRDGHDDLVAALLSCSKSEFDNLSWRIDDLVENVEINASLKVRLQKLLEEKQSAFQSQLVLNGADQSMARSIIENVELPDGALQISPEFWTLLPTLSYDVQKILYSQWGNPEIIAAQITAIHEVGLDSFADLLVRHLDKAASPQASAQYLDSAKKLFETLSQEPLLKASPTERGYAFSSFFNFADPLLAYHTARELFEQPENEYGLRSFGYRLQNIVHGYYLDSSPHIEINPTFISSWKMIAPQLASFSDRDAWIELCASNMRGLEAPQDFVDTFLKGLPLIQKYSDQYMFLKYRFIDSVEPIALLNAFDSLEPFLHRPGNPEIPQKILEWLGSHPKPEQLSARIKQTFELLQNNKIELKDMTTDDFVAFTTFLLNQAESPNSDAESTRFAENWKIQKECAERYEDYMKVLPQGTWRSFAQIPRPDLQQFPHIIDRFQDLGIAQNTAQRMFRSWSTFSAASRITYKDEDVAPRSLTETEQKTATKDQSERIMSEIRAMTRYADLYGKDELTEVIQTFGLYNLSLYEVASLHKQLLQWKSGETPIENVVINARTDWNGSAKDLGNDSVRALGDVEAVFFEAESELDIAKIIVEVGKHERRFGRDPMQTNAIKNILIHAHANAQALSLGPDGQKLDLQDYTNAERKNANPKTKLRINDYRRHLGNNFRVLLQACSTAGETVDGMNIANKMAEYHNTRVEGSPFITSGMLVINPDGSVTYSTTQGKVDSVTYSGR